MALKKTYLKTKKLCKVTFNCPSNDTEQAWLVGDFNNWDRQATPMKKNKEGFTATLELEPGQQYQYRYFLSGEKWANDDQADGYIDTPFGDTKNSICSA